MSLEGFDHCRARFVMAKGVYSVSSGKGRIVDSYDLTDGKTIVQVEIPVMAQSSTVLEIAKK